MCILNQLDRLTSRNANLIKINSRNHRTDKLAMKIGSNLYRKFFLLILIEFTSHCQKGTVFCQTVSKIILYNLLFLIYTFRLSLIVL